MPSAVDRADPAQPRFDPGATNDRPGSTAGRPRSTRDRPEGRFGLDPGPTGSNPGRDRVDRQSTDSRQGPTRSRPLFNRAAPGVDRLSTGRTNDDPGRQSGTRVVNFPSPPSPPPTSSTQPMPKGILGLQPPSSQVMPRKQNILNCNRKWRIEAHAEPYARRPGIDRIWIPDRTCLGRADLWSIWDRPHPPVDRGRSLVDLRSTRPILGRPGFDRRSAGSIRARRRVDRGSTAGRPSRLGVVAGSPV